MARPGRRPARHSHHGHRGADRPADPVPIRTGPRCRAPSRPRADQPACHAHRGDGADRGDRRVADCPERPPGRPWHPDTGPDGRGRQEGRGIHRGRQGPGPADRRLAGRGGHPGASAGPGANRRDPGSRRTGHPARHTRLRAGRARRPQRTGPRRNHHRPVGCPAFPGTGHFQRVPADSRRPARTGRATADRAVTGRPAAAPRAAHRGRTFQTAPSAPGPARARYADRPVPHRGHNSRPEPWASGRTGARYADRPAPRRAGHHGCRSRQAPWASGRTGARCAGQRVPGGRAGVVPVATASRVAADRGRLGPGGRPNACRAAPLAWLLPWLLPSLPWRGPGPSDSRWGYRPARGSRRRTRPRPGACGRSFPGSGRR